MQHVGTVSAKPQLESELLTHVAQILDALHRVGAGEKVEMLSLGYPETHPVGALAASLNEMIQSLSEARGQSERYSRDLQEKLAAIEAQEAAIAELATPILEVWDKVLCMPIVGMVDDARTMDMARTLLATIVQRKASLVVLDITGIHVMDTRVVDHFLRTARAVRLLGARCVLSGVHPNVSQTIVHMGMDLTGIETYQTMRDALRELVGAGRAKPKASLSS